MIAKNDIPSSICIIFAQDDLMADDHYSFSKSRYVIRASNVGSSSIETWTALSLNYCRHNKQSQTGVVLTHLSYVTFHFICFSITHWIVETAKANSENENKSLSGFDWERITPRLFEKKKKGMKRNEVNGKKLIKWSEEVQL